MSKLLELADIISFIPGQNYIWHRQSERPADFDTWSGSKPGHLALYSCKYKVEKPFSYFCFNLKPRPVAIRSRDVYQNCSALLYFHWDAPTNELENQRRLTTSCDAMGQILVKSTEMKPQKPTGNSMQHKTWITQICNTHLHTLITEDHNLSSSHYMVTVN